ncbi:MAG: hypothetical protein LBT47_08165 [Deltaproteobacteria bacterium]|nr:hypothetical protein [Deltaproteobacteria bacterium]
MVKFYSSLQACLDLGGSGVTAFPYPTRGVFSHAPFPDKVGTVTLWSSKRPPGRRCRPSFPVLV